MSDSVWSQRWQPTMVPCPWDFPGKNNGVACHFLLQCMKMKSESEVTQLRPTPSDPMDCSLPGSSVHGIFQARVLEWGAIAFSDVIYGFYLFIFSSWLCCPLRSQNSPQTLQWEDFWCLETSPSRLPPRDGSPFLTLLSLFLSFIFCPTSFQREWAAFLGAWCPPPAFRSCFVKVAQHSNDLLMNLWGRKWCLCPIPTSSSDCLHYSFYNVEI